MTRLLLYAGAALLVVFAIDYGRGTDHSGAAIAAAVAVAVLLVSMAIGVDRRPR